MNDAVLEVSGLTKSFGGVAALAEVSFTVRAGELVALIGPNGAGKSTCFNLINGQLKPDHGASPPVRPSTGFLCVPLPAWAWAERSRSRPPSRR